MKSDMTLFEDYEIRRVYDEIAETVEAAVVVENKTAAQAGGGIAQKVSKGLEAKTGEKVVTDDNHLPLNKKQGINQTKGDSA